MNKSNISRLRVFGALAFVHIAFLGMPKTPKPPRLLPLVHGPTRRLLESRDGGLVTRTTFERAVIEPDDAKTAHAEAGGTKAESAGAANAGTKGTKAASANAGGCASEGDKEIE